MIKAQLAMGWIALGLLNCWYIGFPFIQPWMAWFVFLVPVPTCFGVYTLWHLYLRRA